MQATRGAPYGAALQLAAWALAHLDYMVGRLWLAGVDPGGLGMAEWLDVSYAMQVDLPDGLVNRYEVFKEVNARLDRPLFELLVEIGAIKPHPDIWGRTSAAIAGHRAMMAMAGGPAPMRPKKEEPPK